MRVLAGQLVLEQLAERLVAEAEELEPAMLRELTGRLVAEAGAEELEPPQEPGQLEVPAETEVPVLPLAC